MYSDITVTPYQIWEARAHGADAVELSVKYLNSDQLVSFIERIESLGMMPFVRASNEVEISAALSAGAEVLGVELTDANTRPRDTFLYLTRELPAEIIKVAIGTVRSEKDVVELGKAGARGILVGDHLVTSLSPRHRLAELVAAGKDLSIWR
jgi:indole-3-glycerol phosphate synthase